MAAVHWASLGGSLDVVKALLHAGASVNAPSGHREAPLAEAAAAANAEAERAISRRSRSLSAGDNQRTRSARVLVLDGSADAVESSQRRSSTPAAGGGGSGGGGGGGGRGGVRWRGKEAGEKGRVAAAAAARLRPIQLAVMGGHAAVLEHLLQAGLHIHRRASPCIALHRLASPCIALHRVTSPYVRLPYTAWHRRTCPCTRHRAHTTPPFLSLAESQSARLGMVCSVCRRGPRPTSRPTTAAS